LKKEFLQFMKRKEKLSSKAGRAFSFRIKGVESQKIKGGDRRCFDAA